MPAPTPAPTVPREVLEDLYIKQRLSMHSIAVRLDCTEWSVHIWLQRYGIPKRRRGNWRVESCTDRLDGRVFGQLTVLRLLEDKERPSTWTPGRDGWLCQCECGGLRKIKGGYLRRGLTTHCRARHHTLGPNASQWKGGRSTMSSGYVTATLNGKTDLEHRLVMEGVLGRPLYGNEAVHHKNGIRDDNRPENLEIWVTGYHPSGQRVTDLVTYALEILQKHAPERLALDILPQQG